MANSLQDQTTYEERDTVQDEVKFDRHTEQPALLKIDFDSDDGQVDDIFSRDADVVGNEEERTIQFDYVKSSNNCVDSDYGECDDSSRQDDDIKDNKSSYDCDKSSESNMPEKHRAVRQYQRKKEVLLQGSMNEDEAIRQGIENSLRDKTTYDDKFVDQSGAYKLVQPKPPSFQYLMSQSVDVSDEVQKLPETKINSIQINHINVLLMQGKLAEQETDVLVNVSSPTGSITESKVSQSIFNLGGDQFLQMYNVAINNSFGGVSTMVSTRASGRLRCKTVLHVKLVPGPQNCQQMLGQVLSEILDECCNNGYSSLALPPMGVGRMYKYPAKDVAQQILQTILMYQQGGYNNSLKHVTVVIFKDDHKTYQDFDDAFTSFNTYGICKFISEPHTLLLMEQLSSQHSRGSLQKALGAPLNQDKRQTKRRSYSPARSQHTQSFQGAVALASSSASYKKRQQLKNVPKKHSKAGPADHYSVHSGRPSSHRERFRYSGYPHKSAVRDSSDGHFVEDLRSDPEYLKVEVFSDNSVMCVQARNLLENEIKRKFLYEDKIPKTQNISRDAKKKIKEIIFKHCISSYKDGNGYLLKGNKENVTEARGEILLILLKEKKSQETKSWGQRNVGRGTKEFAKLMHEDDPNIPSYWNMYRPEISFKELLSKLANFLTGKKYKKVSLSQESPHYSAIIKMVNATFDPTKIGKGQDAVGLDQFNYSKLFITDIKRIENPELYEKFARQKQVLFRKLVTAGEGCFRNISDLPGCKGAVLTEALVQGALGEDTHSELNEVFLFHGTNERKVDTICNDGFDNRIGDENAMFGLGIYGAECSIKADQYADDKNARTAGKGQKKKMFLVRMLLGNAFICNKRNPRKYRRPPCTNCLKFECSDTRHVGKFGHLFDSIIGDNGKLFREFVVYDSNMCYPEYLITYERR